MNNNWLAVEILVKDRIEEALREAEQARIIRQVEASVGSERVHRSDALLVLGGALLLFVAG